MNLINEISRKSEKFSLPFEDVLFTYLSRYGINVPLKFSRVRFVFEPEKTKLFSISQKYNNEKYFFALPVWNNSPFYIKEEKNKLSLFIENYLIGNVFELYNDTCDSEYTRNNGTVLNLNPVSKSNCHGCKFCHTAVQDANDLKDTLSCSGLKSFLNSWTEERKLPSLRHLEQIAVVTGTFGKSEEVLNYCKMVRKEFSHYNYEDEIFYFGSEINLNDLERSMKEISPFAWCYTLECFENRDRILKKEKSQIDLNEIIATLRKAKDLNVKVNFSYVLGIDNLSAIKTGFMRMREVVSAFPIINIFQPHHNSSDGVLTDEAKNIDYFFEARKIIEDIYIDTPLRPRTWENYRSPWYTMFANEALSGNRLP